MIAHIVDVIGFIFAILFTRKDTADVGLSGVVGQACGIGSRAEKPDGAIPALRREWAVESSLHFQGIS